MKSQKGGPGPVIEIKDARPMCVTPFEAPFHPRSVPWLAPHGLSVHLNRILSHTKNWQDQSICAENGSDKKKVKDRMVLKLSLYPLPFISLPNAFSSSLDSRMSNMESTMACSCSIVHVRNVVVTKKKHFNCFVGGTGHMRRRNRRWTMKSVDLWCCEKWVHAVEIANHASSRSHGLGIERATQWQ